MKAIVAVEHSIITAIWHMLADGECYADPGADHFTRMDPVKAKNNAIKKIPQPRLQRHHHSGHRSLTNPTFVLAPQTRCRVPPWKGKMVRSSPFCSA